MKKSSVLGLLNVVAALANDGPEGPVSAGLLDIADQLIEKFYSRNF